MFRRHSSQPRDPEDPGNLRMVPVTQFLHLTRSVSGHTMESHQTLQTFLVLATPPPPPSPLTLPTCPPSSQYHYHHLHPSPPYPPPYHHQSCSALLLLCSSQATVLINLLPSLHGLAAFSVALALFLDGRSRKPEAIGLRPEGPRYRQSMPKPSSS